MRAVVTVRLFAPEGSATIDIVKSSSYVTTVCQTSMYITSGTKCLTARCHYIWCDRHQLCWHLVRTIFAPRYNCMHLPFCTLTTNTNVSFKISRSNMGQRSWNEVTCFFLDAIEIIQAYMWVVRWKTPEQVKYHGIRPPEWPLPNSRRVPNMEFSINYRTWCAHIWYCHRLVQVAVTA